MDEKERRGGARPGAGRKREGRVAMTLTVAPGTRDALRRAAVVRGTTPGRLVDGMVRQMLDYNDGRI